MRPPLLILSLLLPCHLSAGTLYVSETAAFDIQYPERLAKKEPVKEFATEDGLASAIVLLRPEQFETATRLIADAEDYGCSPHSDAFNSALRGLGVRYPAGELLDFWDEHSGKVAADAGCFDSLKYRRYGNSKPVAHVLKAEWAAFLIPGEDGKSVHLSAPFSAGVSDEIPYDLIEESSPGSEVGMLHIHPNKTGHYDGKITAPAQGEDRPMYDTLHGKRWPCAKKSGYSLKSGPSRTDSGSLARGKDPYWNIVIDTWNVYLYPDQSNEDRWGLKVSVPKKKLASLSSAPVDDPDPGRCRAWTATWFTTGPQPRELALPRLDPGKARPAFDH